MSTGTVEYGFHTTDGMLARTHGPKLFLIDLYRGNGVWEPYADLDEFAHNSRPIERAHAAQMAGGEQFLDADTTYKQPQQ